MNCVIPVDLVSRASFILPASICAIAMIAVLFHFFRRRQRLGTSGRIVTALSLLVIIATFGSIYHQSTSSEISVDGTQLTARAFFVSASAPLDSLMWDRAQDASTMRLPLRTSGTSFSGVQMGWFRTDEGRSAFALRSGRPSILVPTKGDFDFVLSKPAFDQLLRCKGP